jgi:putative membrane protein
MERKVIFKSVAPVLLALLGLGFDASGQTTPTTPDTAGKTTPPSSSGNAVTPSKPNANGSRLPKADVKFVEKAAVDGLAEVELAKLAQKQAQSPAVKEFADRMVKDHSKANDDLKPLAESKNVVLPSAPDRSHRREMDSLAKKSGADFDKAYMDHMLKDHKKDVKAFQDEAKSGKDPDIKNFAASTLPTLEEHLKMAQQTDNAVKGRK